ncbi:TrmB family transcriptional regulator [Nanoarchaeota archaeon]
MNKMLIKQELINKIKDYFGLNIYETKVWLALLGKGVASAGEIASISGVPRSRTYDVLEGLEKRGFAIIKLGKPVKYLGVKPRVIIEKLKNNVRSDAEEKIQSLAKIKSTEEYSKIDSLYTEGLDPVKREDLSAAIKGKSTISNYLRELLENANKEVIICTNAEEINAKSKPFKQIIEILQKSDIKIKIALSGNEQLIRQIEKDLKIRVKKVNIDSKFFIIDRKEMLVYLSKDTNAETIAIWLNSEFLAQAFAMLFDSAMKNGERK